MKRKKEKKRKLKKNNFAKKKKKKEKKEKLAKKKRKNTVDYCCNPQCFVCGGTVNPPHGLVICIIVLFVMTCNCNSQST